MTMNEILNEYSPNRDIFSEDSELIQRIKWIIFNRLNETDRRIILMYAEYKSYAKVAQKLFTSTTTAYLKVKKIKEEILKYLNGNN